MYFVWEVRPYWAAFGLSHTNCMGFSAIRFVWPKVCLFPKVDRGWQNYFVIKGVDTVNDRVAPMFGFITQLYLICCNYHTFSFEKQAYKEKFKRPNFRSEREQCTVGNV